MKKMLFVVCLLTGAACTTTQAQSKLSDAQKTEWKQRFKTFHEELKLTPEQEPKVRGIDSVYLSGLAALKNSTADKITKFRQWKSLSATRDSQMKNVLTKEQFDTFEKFKAEMRREMQQ
jgi:Spy/CpxP family protein refolding chaperone